MKLKDYDGQKLSPGANKNILVTLRHFSDINSYSTKRTETK